MRRSVTPRAQTCVGRPRDGCKLRHNHENRIQPKRNNIEFDALARDAVIAGERHGDLN